MILICDRLNIAYNLGHPGREREAPTLYVASSRLFLVFFLGTWQGKASHGQFKLWWICRVCNKAQLGL